MRVSIGILAWNESRGISRTVESLSGQSIFRGADRAIDHIEVVCVPNGCADDTAAVAEQALDTLKRAVDCEELSCLVHKIETAGKSFAWNAYVHNLADQDADYVFLMDADIWFDNPDTLWNMIVALEENPTASVSVDRANKDIAYKKGKSAVDRLSLGISALNDSGAPLITGQLYCGRGSFLRRIWMPAGLLLDDAFLAELAHTDLLTAEPRPDRIVRAHNASHVFEAYRSVGVIFRHRRLIMVGSAITALLCGHLRENMGPEGCGELIRRQNEEDNGWLAKFLKSKFHGQTWWVMPIPIISGRRFKALRKLNAYRALVLAPSAIAGCLLDTAAVLSANQWVKRTDASLHWEKMRAN